MRNNTNKCTYENGNLLFIKSVAFYMFRPPIVAVFRAVLFEGYIS